MQRVMTAQIVDVRRRMLRRLVTDAVEFLQLREKTKSAVLALGGEVRRVHLALGRRLHASGVLKNPLDVDLLGAQELESAFAGSGPSLWALERRRNVLDRLSSDDSVPQICVGDPSRRLGASEIPPGDTFRGGGAVAGPVCSVTGFACRVVDFRGSYAGTPGTAAELIRTRWSKCDDCDGEEFLTQGLAVLSREFREGLDAYDADDYTGCARRMAALVSSTSPFISTNAAAYEIKSLIALDQMWEEAQRIEQLTDGGGKRLAAHSYFSSEMMFLEGYCLLADLKEDGAEEAVHDC